MRIPDNLSSRQQKVFLEIIKKCWQLWNDTCLDGNIAANTSCTDSVHSLAPTGTGRIERFWFSDSDKQQTDICLFENIFHFQWSKQQSHVMWVICVISPEEGGWGPSVISVMCLIFPLPYQTILSFYIGHFFVSFFVSGWFLSQPDMPSVLSQPCKSTKYKVVMWCIRWPFHDGLYPGLGARIWKMSHIGDRLHQ